VNDLATNPQGDGAVAPAAETEVIEPVKNPETETDVEAKPESQAAEDDSDEVEHDGRKYRVPKALKGAFLMHADYTRKTQEVAEQRRSLEERNTAFAQQEAAVREHLQDVARLVAISEQIAQFEHADWNALRASAPDQAQDLWFQYQQMLNARNIVERELQAKVTNRAQELQRHAAKRFDEGRAVLQRDIKDWSPELAGKMTEFAVREFGLTPNEVNSVSDPRLVKLLHRAYLGDQAIRKATASAKLAAQEGLKPPAQVGNGASSNARKPTDASGDRLSADEWMRQRNEQLRKNR